MVIWTDDPVRDFERWDEEQEQWFKTLPRCSMCGQPIQDEHMYIIRNTFYCPGCIEDAETENTALTEPLDA